MYRCIEGVPEYGTTVKWMRGPLVRPIHVTPTLVKTVAYDPNGDSYTCNCCGGFTAKIALEIVNTYTMS